MGTVMEIRRPNAGFQRKLQLDKDVRDALADYARTRWPNGTAKAFAREFNLTVDEGRAVVSARTSLALFVRILKAGGWGPALQYLAPVIGEGVDQHLTRERQHHADQAARLGALANDLWPSAPVPADRADCVAAEDAGGLEPGRRRVGAGADQGADR